MRKMHRNLSIYLKSDWPEEANGTWYEAEIEDNPTSLIPNISRYGEYLT
jgi:hypothetical protein